MKTLGFNFTKISAEKINSLNKDTKITSGINISSIEESNFDLLKTKDSVLIVKWKFEISYNINVAKILFEGNLNVALDSKKSKEVLSKWKDKKLDEEFNLVILNIILKKCNIKALQFEEEFNLPTHFKLPSLKTK